MAKDGRNQTPVLPLTAFDQSYTSIELGRGSYGLVETVKFRGSICAIKHIHANLLKGPGREKIIDDFLQECNRCSDIIHENIVRFYGAVYFGRPADIPSLAMEKLDTSLSDYITENPAFTDTWIIKLSLLSDVAKGLNYLHTALSPPMIHRDLSPKNVLLIKNNTTSSGKNDMWIAKIADLGMAKVLQPGKLNTPVPGAQIFMPPEAFKQSPDYTTSLDVFSYGGVMLFVATNEWPIPTYYEDVSEVERRRQYLDKIPKEVKELKPLIKCCLSNDKKGRPTMKYISEEIKKLYNRKKDYSEIDSEAVQKLILGEPSEDDLRDLIKDPKPLPVTHYPENKWYVGCVSTSEAAIMLTDLFDGTFFVRETKEEKNEYAICVKFRQPHHIKIFFNQQVDCFFVAEGKEFRSIYIKSHSTWFLDGRTSTCLVFGCSLFTARDLIYYYEEHSLASHFSHIDTNLKTPYCIIRTPLHKEIKFPWWSVLSKDFLPPLKSSKSPQGSPSSDRQKMTIGQKFRSFLRRKQGYNIPLEEEVWYHGEISRDDAIQLIKDDGDYLVRFSNAQGSHILTAKWDGTIKHFIFDEWHDQKKYQYCMNGSAKFPSISEFLTYHVEKQISITRNDQFFLKQPVSKQIDYDNLLLDDKPLYTRKSSCIYFATLKDSKKRVIVKKCLSDQPSEKQAFLQEADILKQLKHSNIIKLLSVCDINESTCIVLEMMSENFLWFLQESKNGLTAYQLTSLLLDAAMAMEYLTSQNYIHMDLSARSCMIRFDDHAVVLKIFNFSKCRKAENGLFVLQDDANSYVSIRWAAPEAFSSGIYTPLCDVWSYGVLMYETYSYGELPYIDINEKEILSELQQGLRLTPPEGTPKAVHKEIMAVCWDILPKQRPTFQDIVFKLRDITGKLPKK